MIKVHRIPIETIEHFDPDNNSMGFLNEYENLDLTNQIADEKASGYYLLFENKKIDIRPDGKHEWPMGLYNKIAKGTPLAVGFETVS